MRFSDLDGARIGVWGAGREVASLAAQLARRLPSARIEVAAFDAAPDAEQLASVFPRLPSQIVLGDGAVPQLRGCDVVVRSPGVSIHRPELIALREAGVPVTTATSLWLCERGGRRVIAITGTKGKSTTAALCAHLARAAGTAVQLAGNIGAPALDLLDVDPGEPVVLELSSYQIADLEQGPQAAVLVNLYREHLDWHGSEEAYRAEKLRILSLPGVRAAVVNGRQGELTRAAAGLDDVRRFGVPSGWDVRDGTISRVGERVCDVAALPLPGEHNALNLCAALSALEALDLPVPRLPAALADFAPLAHRLQTVAQRDGVLWVDDSISTTPESTLAALASFPGRDVVLIAGGQDRGQDYEGLAGALAASATSAVIGIPTTGPRLVAAALRAGVPGERALEAGDLEEAVRLARERAVTGSVVLLSPAAPSYDRFRDFEQRGERFAALAVED